MKYVRTKDKILPYYDESETGKLNAVLQVVNMIWSDEINEKFNEIVLKEADTIEELCDEFIVAYEDGSRIIYSDLEWAKTKAKASLEVGNKSIIYGAIWTREGLIYVAKMNDKGELELL